MPDIILHDNDLSPCSEKIRLTFAIKDLARRSAIQPMILRKPVSPPTAAQGTTNNECQ